MPELVGFVAQRKPRVGRHDLAVGADSGEDDEVGAGADGADLGDLERPEAAREGKLDVVGHLLAAEHQNRMVLERRAHRLVG